MYNSKSKVAKFLTVIFMLHLVLMLVLGGNVFALTNLTELFEREIPKIVNGGEAVFIGDFTSSGGAVPSVQGDYWIGMTGACKNGRFLKMYGAASSALNEAAFTKSLSGAAVNINGSYGVLRVNLLMKDYDGTRGIEVRLNGTNSLTGSQSNNVIEFSPGGTMFSHGKNIGGYQLNKWYYIEAYYHKGTKLYDLYVNGEKKVNQDNPLNTSNGNNIASINRTRVSQRNLANSGKSAVMYIDDLQLRDTSDTYDSSQVDTTVMSPIYMVDNNKGVIAGVPVGCTVEDLKNNLILPTGATVKVYQSDEVTEGTGKVTEDMVVSVTSAGGFALNKFNISYVNHFYLDGRGEQVSAYQLLDDDSLYISAHAQNPEEALVMIAALYHPNGCLDTATFDLGTVSQEGVRQYDITMALPPDVQGYTMKTFLWDSLENMMPQSKSSVLN